MVPIHINKELHKKGARLKNVRLCKSDLYDISISRKCQKMNGKLTLPKQFSLTAKSFFCFSRAN